MKIKHLAAVLLVATTGLALASCSQPKTTHHSAEKTAQVKPKPKKQSIVGYYRNAKELTGMYFKKNGRGRYAHGYLQACSADSKFTWKKTGKKTYDLHYDNGGGHSKVRFDNKNKVTLLGDGSNKAVTLARTAPFDLEQWLQAEINKQNKAINKQKSKADSSSSASDKYGNEGPVNAPSEMQGTWYGKDNTVSFTGNTITLDGESTKIFRQSSSFANSDQMMDQAVAEATQGWRSGKLYTAQGMQWLHLRGWTQTAGAGTSYAVHTENIDGKSVKILVAGGGAENWVFATYFQSQALADQYGDQQFDDLNYE